MGGHRSRYWLFLKLEAVDSSDFDPYQQKRCCYVRVMIR
jgi:hypothetical protein